jgi:hypothetical protein
MYDTDLSDSPELRELRDAVSGVATSGPPPVESIMARARARRRQRLTTISRMSVGGVVAATALALGVSGAFSPAAKLGTIRTAAYTLRHNANGTDTLTLNPVELLGPSQLQSDFARYGIPSKVTSGSYCTSDPAPAGFAQAVTGPSGGSWRVGSGQQPTITIDPSQIPSGTELSVGYFQLTSGPAAGEQQANMSLINTNSYTCSSTPPDMSQPDTSNEDLGVLYGGSGPSGS